MESTASLGTAGGEEEEADSDGDISEFLNLLRLLFCVEKRKKGDGGGTEERG
jgi:hypothetical protein